MIRAIQVSFVIAAAFVCAACSHLQAARRHLEYRGFLEDWGANNRKQIWIYQP